MLEIAKKCKKNITAPPPPPPQIISTFEITKSEQGNRGYILDIFIIFQGYQIFRAARPHHRADIYKGKQGAFQYLPSRAFGPAGDKNNNRFFIYHT